MQTGGTTIEQRPPLSERLAAWAVAIAAASALATAFGLEHLGGWAPCSLCVLERWPWAMALISALAGLAFGRRRAALATAALVLAGNALLSAYHVGVEAGWFALPSTCTGGGSAATIEELRTQLAAARPTCDRVALRIFGLSLAAWNGLASAAVAALAIAALARARRVSS